MKEPRMKLTDAEAEAFTRYLTRTAKKKKKSDLEELVDALLSTEKGKAILRKYRIKK